MTMSKFVEAGKEYAVELANKLSNEMEEILVGNESIKGILINQDADYSEEAEGFDDLTDVTKEQWFTSNGKVIVLRKIQFNECEIVYEFVENANDLEFIEGLASIIRRLEA